MAGQVRELNQETFEAIIERGVTLVDFWAPWCMPCRMQAPILDAVAAEVAGATVAKVNVDEQADLAGRYEVMSIPTLVVFKDGKEINRFVAVQQKDTLVAALQAALA